MNGAEFARILLNSWKFRSMARTWESTTARLLRQAKGAPLDAGLGLVIQVMAFGLEKENVALTLQLLMKTMESQKLRVGIRSNANTTRKIQ